MKKQDQELMEIAQKGGDDADLFLLDKIHNVADEVETLKKEQGQDTQINAHVEKVAMKLAAKLATLEKGETGEQGLQGERGESGVDGRDGKDGANGKDGKSGKDGLDGKDGRDGRDGRDGVDGVNGQDGASDTPDQVVEKINTSSLLIKKERVEGLLDAISRSIHNGIASVGITTTNFFSNGALVGRAKNINFTNAIISVAGDMATISTSASVGGGITGTVDGSNLTFVAATPPSIVFTEGGHFINGFGVTITGLTIVFDAGLAPQQWIKYV